MHAEYKCPGCGLEHGALTDHPASERKCHLCLAGVWGGGAPGYPPGKEHHKGHFDAFVADQAAKGNPKAVAFMAKKGVSRNRISTPPPLPPKPNVRAPGLKKASL